jgi:hypothetical protein
MMLWIGEGMFPGAQKGERRTDPWLLPVDEVEAKRLQLLAKLEEDIRAISKPASMYRFNYVAQNVAPNT